MDSFKHLCFFDSGKQDTQRILIFLRHWEPQITKLYNKIWLEDSTLKIWPSQFYQLYTVDIHIGGLYPPCVYTLLSKKRLSAYYKIRAAIKSLIGDLNRESFLIDFETAALSVFASHNETGINECFFHLSHNFMRKISELGLEKT